MSLALQSICRVDHTGAGDVALVSSQALTILGTGNITSTTGDVRLASTAAGVTINGVVSTAGGVSVSAATSLSMSTGSIVGFDDHHFRPATT